MNRFSTSMKSMRVVVLVVSLFASVCWLQAAEPQVWRYQLLEGSYLVDDCLLCGRPPIQLPMRGSFTLRLVEANPIVSRYSVENIDFHAGGSGSEYLVTGSGTYEAGGEVALHQAMSLAADLKTPSGQVTALFTNNGPEVTRPWPMLAITVTQTNGTVTSTISLNIAAAPIREIWFSTASTFHTDNVPAPDDEISSGDLLSSGGRVVKRNGDLQENFPGPTYLNLGLDAFDLRPGAEIAFSGDSAGLLSDGDIAFQRAFHILRAAEFLPILAPGITNDPGVDALSFEFDTRFYFSIEQDVTGTNPTNGLHHGDLFQIDLASHQGSVFKANYQLLAQFHPPPSLVPQDYGLDAVYVWPSGEIWFSLRDGFEDLRLGPITGGDILSDQGYIVYRNLELLSPLAPMEDLANFGLDGLSVISDAAAAPGPSRLSAKLRASDNAVVLTWQGEGRVFQVERASEINGPYVPISEIISDLRFEDAVPSGQAHWFYRLRQW